MSDERFNIELDTLERTLSLEEFMLFCYKTSFCPSINQKHEWSDCNFAHRQQDFRRPPSLFYYQAAERCQYISEDGNWENCPDLLDCQNCHTLVEYLYSPLMFKQKECADKVEGQHFTCPKRGELCSLYHSIEERDIANKAIRKMCKDLNYNDSMKFYI
jgi:hypothetical protein